jgi:ADP-heptose:LPS heptosyltransferase
MAWIIFLAPADLGETVLASGAVAHALRDPRDMLTIVGGPEAAALFRGAPSAKICAPKEGPLTFAAGVRLQPVRCDILIDAQGGIAGRIIPANTRIRLQPSPVLRHLAEAWGEAAGAERAVAPKLWVDDAARAASADILPDAAPSLVLAPGGVTANKRWPRERFAAAARRLVDGPLEGARVVVLGAAARDADITRAIVSSLDADGVVARDLGEGPDLLTAAALLERATLCIGNDNALTHIAAAIGAPTLTLFGPTDERVRAPYGPRARTLRGRSLEDIAALPALDVETAMGDISVDAVEAAALELLHAGGLR